MRKYGGKLWLIITKLFQFIEVPERIPLDRDTSKISSIYKKARKQKKDIYKEVSVFQSTTRVFGRIVKKLSLAV